MSVVQDDVFVIAKGIALGIPISSNACLPDISASI
jgi:acetylornithine/succinyldiaminopimelate/putrescine aminotransferase